MVDRGMAKVTSSVWPTIDPGITKAVEAVTGPASAVNVMTEGRMHAHALHIVTERGTFFFKSAELSRGVVMRAIAEELAEEEIEAAKRGVAGPLPAALVDDVRAGVADHYARAFDMTVAQARTEAVLPPNFPAPSMVAHGVRRVDGESDDDPNRAAWIVTEWVEGRVANDHHTRGTEGLADRVTAVARRSVLPVEEVTDPDALVDLSQAMRESYLGNWDALERVFAHPERLWSDDPRDDRTVEEWARGFEGPDGDYEDGYLGSGSYNWLRENFDRLKASDQILAPRLRNDHVAASDAHRENVLIAEAGPESDVLIDNVYGKGPAEFTAFTLVVDAWHAGICDGEDLDRTMAAIGVSPEVTDAWLAGCAGFAIARRYGLKSTPDVGNLGPASSADPKFLLEKLAERVEARGAAAADTSSRSPALDPELTDSAARSHGARSRRQPFIGPNPTGGTHPVDALRRGRSRSR